MGNSKSLQTTTAASRILNARGLRKVRVRLSLSSIFLGFLLPILSQPVAASGLGRSNASALPLKDTNYTFSVTQVGQTTDVCRNVCFCSDGNNCTCDQSGTISLTHYLSAPFSAYSYRVQSIGNSNDCGGGTPVSLPVFIGVGQKLSYVVEFSPTNPGTFSNYLGFNGYSLFVSGSTPRGEASLVPSALAGWSAPLVVSTSPGTQTDSPNLTSAEPLYLSWSIQNQGDLATFGTFFVDVNLDGSLLSRWSWSDPLQPKYYLFLKDYRLGPLSVGTHTLELVPDPTNVILASSSTFSKTITVSNPGPPPPPSKPVPSTSWYVQAIDKFSMRNDPQHHALQAWANNIGQQAGQTNASPTNAKPFVILNFGHPYQFQDGTFGATGYSGKSLKDHLNLSDIENIAKQFILGYEMTGHCCLTLAVGTTNEEVSGDLKHPYVTPAHASAWAQMLVDLDKWSATRGFPALFVASASDAELGFNSPQVTQAWFQAFDDGLQVGSINNYDFGDAAGCSGLSAINPQTCQLKPYKWTQVDVANLLAVGVPQVYNNGQALDWQAVYRYQIRRSDPPLLRGVLSQRQACVQRGEQTCQGMDNDSTAAWDELVMVLSKGAASQELPYLSFSSDIKWGVK